MIVSYFDLKQYYSSQWFVKQFLSKPESSIIICLYIYISYTGCSKIIGTNFAH